MLFRSVVLGFVIRRSHQPGDALAVDDAPRVAEHGREFHQPVRTVAAVQVEGESYESRTEHQPHRDTYRRGNAQKVHRYEEDEYPEQPPGEDEEILSAQALELDLLADAFVDAVPSYRYRKKERSTVAATIKKMQAPNHEDAVFDVSGSPELSSRSATLLGLSPLRTVRASFPAYGSSNIVS